MNFYRITLILVFLSVGSFAAWMFDESHLLQGVTEVSTARELLNKAHLQMAIIGLVSGGLAILIVDEIRKRILKNKLKSDNGSSCSNSSDWSHFLCVQSRRGYSSEKSGSLESFVFLHQFIEGKVGKMGFGRYRL